MFRANCVVLCHVVLTTVSVSAAPPHSVSTSRQFIVYGSDIRIRGAICDLAEKTKRDLLQILGQRDEWTTPIVVNAQDPQINFPGAPQVVLDFAQTGVGLKIQLDLIIDSTLAPLQVQRELLRAVLLEMMYRTKRDLPAGVTFIAPPAWLLDGFPFLYSNLDREKMIELLAIVVARHKMPSLGEFMELPTLLNRDVTGHCLYRAYSFALVELLLQSPDGPRRLSRFITSISSTSNEPMDVGRYFPELGTPALAEKAWRLHLERFANAASYQLLTPDETEQRLDQLLTFRIRDSGAEKKCRLQEFPRFAHNPSARLALASLSRDLLLLSNRSHPAWRSVVEGYADVALLLAHGRTKPIAKRLTNLGTARKGVTAELRKINHYLDWFEVTKARKPSGNFTQYMRIPDTTQRQKRRDRISVYLDYLETQLF